MKIISLNGWGGKLYDALAAYIEAENPDVLCLQEVVHTPGAVEDWLTYRDGDHILPQRANLFDDVARILPGHVHVFCPAAQGVLWDDERPMPSQWGLATFVRKTFPIVAQAQGFVHKAYSPHGYGEHPRSRCAHAIRVFDYERGMPLCVAHMHGLRDPRGKADTPERAAQARKFLDLIVRVAEADDAVVACGDFNVEPNSETLQILSEAGLTELVTSRGHSGTRTSHYPKLGRFADYMLVNERVVVRDFAVVAAPEVSDHCPLLLRL